MYQANYNGCIRRGDKIKHSSSCNYESCRTAKWFGISMSGDWDKITETKTFDATNGYTCNICDLTVYTITSYLDHLKGKPHNKMVASTKNPIRCVICSKTVTSLKSLDLHMDSHNTSKQRYHRCMTCDKIFDNIKSLMNHWISLEHVNKSKNFDYDMKADIYTRIYNLCEQYKRDLKSYNYPDDVINDKIGEIKDLDSDFLKTWFEHEKCIMQNVLPKVITFILKD